MDYRTLLPALAIGGGALVTVVVLRVITTMTRRAYENLQRLGTEFELSVREVRPVMGFYRKSEANGSVRGKPVRIYNDTTGSGKSQTTWSVVAVKPRAVGDLNFALTRQGMKTSVLERFGAKGIQIGEREFDDQWFIETSTPDFLRAALLPELRRKIQTHRGLWKLADGEVTYAEPGSFSNRQRAERFVAIVDLACDLADVAEVYAQQPTK